jgi:hypothetical protein
MADLGESVNARIGPPAADGKVPMSGDFLDSVAQGALDAGAVGLDLPALKIGAIVRDDQFEFSARDQVELRR